MYTNWKCNKYNCVTDQQLHLAKPKKKIWKDTCITEMKMLGSNSDEMMIREWWRMKINNQTDIPRWWEKSQNYRPTNRFCLLSSR